MPSSDHRGQEVDDVAAVDRHRESSSEPGDDRRQRGQQHGARAEAAVQPRREAEREHADRQRDRQERRAGADRVVAEHALQVQDGEEEHAEHARDHQHLHQVRARRRCGSAGCRARSSGRSAVRLAPDERRPAARRRPRRAAASARRRSCRRRASARRSRAPRPARRRRRAGRGPVSGASSRAPSSHAATPIGTLTKKIQCQSSAWVSTPPASRPIDAPAEATNEKTPIAFACSPGSGNIVTIIPRITAEAERAADALDEARGDQHLGLSRTARTAARPA